MSLFDVAADLRRMFRGCETASASGMVSQQIADAVRDPVRDEIRAEMKRRRCEPSATVLGETEDEIEIVFPEARTFEHAVISGVSGGGKTCHAISRATPLLPRVLERPRNGGLVILDPKGEVTELFQRVIASYLQRLPPGARHRALSRVRVIDPFDEANVPPLNMLVPPEGVEPDVYLGLFASSLADTTAPPGIRQRAEIRWRLRLAREHGLLAPLFPKVFGNPYILDALVRRSSPEIRAGYADRQARDASDVIRGVDIRFEEFLALRSTRRALATESAFDFRAALDGGITLINIGNAPYGSRLAQRFWGQILMARLVAAIFARSNSPNQPPAVIFADEIQELMLPEIAEDLPRVLALARARRVGIWATVQEIGQLAAASPLFAHVLLTNVTSWTTFAVAQHDRHFVRSMLRATGHQPRPPSLPWERQAGGYFLRPEEELRALVDGATSLPPRAAYFWDRRATWGALRIRTADVNIPEAEDLPNALFGAVQKGAIAIPLAEIDARLERESARLDALARPAVVAAPRAEAQQPAAAPRGEPRAPRVPRARVALPNLG